MRALVVLAVTVAATLAVAASASADVYLSPTGDNLNPCTQAAPCRTMLRGEAVATSGTFVRMAPGTYGAQGVKTSLTKAGVTYAANVGEARPSLLGRYSIDGTGVRFYRVVMDGPTGPVGGNGLNGNSNLVNVNAGGFRIDHSLVKESLGHAGIYVSAGATATGISIDHNLIRDNGCWCGTFANNDHGVYWNTGSGSITNNVIEHNLARGVSLYSGDSTVMVKHNTVVANGRQGLFDGSSAGTDTFANNILAFNGQNLTSTYALYYFSGNPPVAYSNLFFNNYGHDYNGGFTNVNPFVGDPLFVKDPISCGFTGPCPVASLGDYHLQAGSAAANRGDPAYSVANDFDNRPRDAQPDIGAYELIP